MRRVNGFGFLENTKFRSSTCGGGLGFFSMDVEASRIGLILISNDDALGVGKLQWRRRKIVISEGDQ
jgi:hypothetical protein